MAESNSGPGLNDLLSLFGGNPLSMIGKSVTQFQSGIASFLHSVENFNETMEQMNGVARRINTMLDDIEPIVKAAVPQITRTLRAADELVEQMSIPIERVAPGLMRLADSLSSPVVSTFPRDLSQFVEMFGDVARRMQPLGQLAETAGGFFGGMNPLTALRNAASGSSGNRGGASSAPPAPREPVPEPAVVHVFDDEPEPRPTTRRSSTAKKSSAAQRSPAKKSGSAGRTSSGRSGRS